MLPNQVWRYLLLCLYKKIHLKLDPVSSGLAYFRQKLSTFISEYLSTLTNTSFKLNLTLFRRQPLLPDAGTPEDDQPHEGVHDRGCENNT